MQALLEDMKSGQVGAYDVPAPELQPGGLLVRTAFSAISAGTEKATVQAGRKSLLGKALARPDLARQVFEYAQTNGLRAARQKVQARLDTLSALGYSCSGLVLKAGSAVNGWHPGDRVACAGAGYASHCAINYVPANLAVRVPANVSLEAASLTTIGAIAIQGVRQANVTFGETIAVIGAGLVGVLTMQILRAAGCRVIAIDLSEERAAEAVSFGAHLGLSVADSSLEGAVAAFSRYGVDAALITAATKSAEPLELAAKLLRDRGRIVVVGDVGMDVARNNMYRKELSLSMSRSYGPGRYDPAYEEAGQDYPIGYVRWTEQRNMEAFLDLLSAGSIKVEPLLARRYPVEDGAQAYAAVEAGAYSGIIDYHAGADALPVAPPSSRAAEVHPPNGKLRVGCIGAGAFARGVILPALKASADLTLASVATMTGAAAVSAQAGFGFTHAESPSALLDNPDLDVVFVLTRHSSHAAYVTQALDQGKAVFVEKPLAVDSEQFEMVRTAYERALVNHRSPFLMVGFNRRFAPFTQKLMAFFGRKTTGRKRSEPAGFSAEGHHREPMLVHIRCNAGFLSRDSWIQAEENGGRIVGELCHFVDWARAVVGCPMKSLTASGLPDAGRYTGDNVTVTIAFADGSIANLLYLANGDKAVAKEYYEVFCGGSIATLDDFKTLSCSRDGKTETSKASQDKGHRRELALTIEALKHGKEAPISFTELTEVTLATFAVKEALRTQKPVAL